MFLTTICYFLSMQSFIIHIYADCGIVLGSITMSSIVCVTLSGFILVCRMNPRSLVTAYPANEARSGILHH